LVENTVFINALRTVAERQRIACGVHRFGAAGKNRSSGRQESNK
jgi:hypothetical protein